MGSSLALAILAGLVTTFSPCVIPVIPLVVGGAAQSGKKGPLYLLSGLVTSFTLAGSFAAFILFQLDLAPDILTKLGGWGLVTVGLFLIVHKLDQLFKKLTNSSAGKIQERLQRFDMGHPLSQFFVGALIGVIWAPCTGPTLGAAIALASQGENLLQALLTMLAFSLGACLPLGIYALLGKKLLKNMSGLISTGLRLRQMVAVIFLAVGTSILLNLHKSLEVWILNHLPEWWVNFITKF